MGDDDQHNQWIRVELGGYPTNMDHGPTMDNPNGCFQDFPSTLHVALPYRRTPALHVPWRVGDVTAHFFQDSRLHRKPKFLAKEWSRKISNRPGWIRWIRWILPDPKLVLFTGEDRSDASSLGVKLLLLFLQLETVCSSLMVCHDMSPGFSICRYF